MDRIIEKLFQHICTGKVVPFLGSGFSFKAGGPSVAQIISAIIKEAGEGFEDEIPENERTLRNVSERFVSQCNSRNELITLLRDIFNFEPKDTTNQQLLTKIPQFKCIFTTNYDTLIEDAYMRQNCNVVTSNQGCAYIDENKTSIYKIHGDLSNFNNPDAIVITESDYRNYFTSDCFSMLWKELQNSFVKKYILFVGYSLEDDNILEIIEQVRQCIGCNMKGMFLVAPNLQRAKVDWLEKNSVTYIDDTAEDFLDKTLQYIKEDIVSFYNKKKVSQEIFDKFCEDNGNLYTQATHKKDSNQIEAIEALDGCKKEETIHMDMVISRDIKYELGKCGYNTCMPIKGTDITVPAIRIAKDEITDISYWVNGIKFQGKDEVSSVLVSPSIEDVQIIFKIPSIRFKEKLIGYRHYEDKVIHIDFQTPICTLKLEVDTSNSEKFTLRYTTKWISTYANSADAIKWINFLIAMYSGKEFYMDKQYIPSRKECKKEIDDFKRVKRYYEIIQEIELETDVVFNRYDNYTEQNLKKAEVVYAYLLRKSLSEEIPHDATVTFKVDIRDKNNSPEKLRKDKIVMIHCEPFRELKLNGQSFNIPYKTIIFKDCKAESITAIDEYRYNIVMADVPQYVCVWYADEMPSQEGNILHLGPKRIA
jgi:hypothetical protein